ncbi:unnamed protein product, partial [Staurois parvus]
MSGRYRYPPNVRTVQISPKCQDGTDIPQMSGRYRYPPNVRRVQISPKCQESTDIPQMSGEYRYPPNDGTTYFIRGMASFLKLYFFFVI